jgi:hypothetical protein
MSIPIDSRANPARREVLSVSRETYEAAVNRIEKLEAAVRKWASECGECDGKGYTEQHDDRPFIDDYVQTPCPDCSDIREYLK